jgi:hypothetical protein
MEQLRIAINHVKNINLTKEIDIVADEFILGVKVFYFRVNSICIGLNLFGRFNHDEN